MFYETFYMGKKYKLSVLLLIVLLLLSGCTSADNLLNSDDILVSKINSYSDIEILNSQVENNGIVVKLRWAFLDSTNLYLLISSYNDEHIFQNFNIGEAFVLIDGKEISANYKNDVQLNQKSYNLLKFEVEDTESQKAKLVLNSINGKSGYWEIPFEIVPIYPIRYSVEKNYDAKGISVYLDYIETTALHTKVKCVINIDKNVMPLIHQTTTIKIGEKTYNYLEGSGAGEKYESNYLLTFEGIEKIENLIIFIELKSGEKIEIPCNLS